MSAQLFHTDGCGQCIFSTLGSGSRSFGNQAYISVQTGLQREEEVPSSLIESKRKPQTLLRLKSPQCNIDAMPQMKGKSSTITRSTLMSIY